jgi:hypothetical protein
MLNYKKNGQGFTILETMMGFCVLMIVVISMVAALTVSIKSTSQQQVAGMAQSLAEDIMAREVRNTTFETLFNTTDGNGNSIQTIVNSTAPSVSVINKLITSTTDYPMIAKLPPSPKITLKLKPVQEGSSYSVTKVIADVNIEWGGKKDINGNYITPSRQLELSTVVAKDGLFASSTPLPYLVSSTNQ